MTIQASNTVSSILLRNGTASLIDLYPLTKVQTAEDKEQLAKQGYNPGFTVSEWPFALPAERIFYSRHLFPGTYYYDPDNAVIPIVLNLNIYGEQRMPIIEDENEFCKFILDRAEELKQPTVGLIRSYLVGHDDGFRSELLAAYIERNEPTPDLYEVFTDFYTATDYGAGAYKLPLLQKVLSGRSAEQKAATADALSSYPEVLTIYRGEADGSTPYDRAYSWTLDVNTAIFFASRHGDKNHARVIHAKVRKADVAAAFLDQGEAEVLVLSGHPFEVEVEELIGPGSPLLQPLKYLKEFHTGREMIRCLYKTSSRKHGDHDALHSVRVLFLAYAIIQAGGIKLTQRERCLLRMAIVYHDIGRTNDAEDDSHGANSRRIFEKHFSDEMVGFLIQHHCLDDREAEAWLAKRSPVVRLLYQILKDADALDRVRFGIAALDVNYLRLPISHKLVPLAVAAVRSIEL